MMNQHTVNAIFVQTLQDRLHQGGDRQITKKRRRR